MEDQEIDDFRRHVEAFAVAFEARFGMKPTALVMCPDDAEIWIEAQKRGLPLFEGLEISVNPFASVSGMRSAGLESQCDKSMLH